MYKLLKFILFSFIAFICSGLKTLAQEWEDSLRYRLNEAISRTETYSNFFSGVCVFDLNADSILFGYNHHKMMRPASTQKMVTAVAALDQLGANHPFITRVSHSGYVEIDTINGNILHGNLYVKGDMDPLLEYSDLQLIADTIFNLGIKKIDGYILADISMKDTIMFGNGWCWDDPNPILTPLLMKGNTSNSTRARINTYRPEDYFVSSLANELTTRGVEAKYKTRSQNWETRFYDSDSTTTVITFSHTLTQVLHRMMKNSDNKHAECVFYQIGAENHPNCSSKDCIEKVMETIERAGLNKAEIKVADGSGLSLYNYITPWMEVGLLRYAFHNTRIYDHLYEAMPIAGIDGTISERMQTSSAFGNVRAKTGTVNRVSSLTGYLRAPNGHMIAFSIINNGVTTSSDGKAFQDMLCDIITRQ